MKSALLKTILVRKIFFVPLILFSLMGSCTFFATESINQFTGFHLKAAQSEAKVKLVTLFTFQKAYFAEHETYTPCLENSELRTHNSDKYAIGFSGLSENGFDCEKTADIPQSLQVEIADVVKLLSEHSSLQKDRFKLVAVGRLCPADKCVLDVWTIDHDRKMEQIQDGKRKTYPYRSIAGLLLFLLIPILFIIRKIIMRTSKPKVEPPIFTK